MRQASDDIKVLPNFVVVLLEMTRYIVCHAHICLGRQWCNRQQTLPHMDELWHAAYTALLEGM